MTRFIAAVGVEGASGRGESQKSVINKRASESNWMAVIRYEKYDEVINKFSFWQLFIIFTYAHTYLSLELSVLY